MKRLFAIALLFAGLAARAQETPTVTARVEPDSIMIGDRFDYVIDVEKDLVQVVEFPVFDPRDGKIELVENCPVDTLERDGRRLKLRKRYRLAAFDEGKYNLGAAQVLYADKNILDTLRSTDSVYLEVATFQIDSTSQSIYDLKAQKNLPFRFREVSGYVKWGVFFLLMLLAAGYALKRYLASRGKGFGDLFKPAPPLPPHVAAIQALEALHNQKLWQNNRHKQYYSGLTDILRTYIAARWGHGDDLRRDHRDDAPGGAARQGADGPDGDPARRRPGEVRQGDARGRAERGRLPQGVLLRRGDETRRGGGSRRGRVPEAKLNATTMYKSLYIILFLFTASGAQAQQLPERSLVRKGNRQYNKGNYEQSAGRYEQALQAAPGQFEAIYNLGNALYKAERFDRAEQTMQQAAADSLRADTERAEAFYNLGNAQFKQQKYQEALESYKQSLRLNPSDMEAKYNYAYTKRLLDENKDGGGGGGDQNKDQNKDQNQNDQSQQNPDQKGDQKDQKGDPKDQQGDQKQNPQEGKGDKEDQGDQQGQPTPSGISPQEQQQMLDAIQAQEDKTQEKLKEKQGVVVRGKKNW